MAAKKRPLALPTSNLKFQKTSGSSVKCQSLISGCRAGNDLLNKDQAEAAPMVPEYSCPVCSRNLTDLKSIDLRNVHIIGCLDRTQNSAPSNECLDETTELLDCADDFEPLSRHPGIKLINTKKQTQLLLGGAKRPLNYTNSSSEISEIRSQIMAIDAKIADFQARKEKLRAKLKKLQTAQILSCESEYLRQMVTKETRQISDVLKVVFRVKASNLTQVNGERAGHTDRVIHAPVWNLSKQLDLSTTSTSAETLPLLVTEENCVQSTHLYDLSEWTYDNL